MEEVEIAAKAANASDFIVSMPQAVSEIERNPWIWQSKTTKTHLQRKT